MLVGIIASLSMNQSNLSLTMDTTLTARFSHPHSRTYHLLPPRIGVRIPHRQANSFFIAGAVSKFQTVKRR